MLSRLSQAIEELDAEHGEIFVLRHLEVLTIPQIAQVTGVPESTVYSRLSRARDKIVQRSPELGEAVGKKTTGEGEQGAGRDMGPASCTAGALAPPGSGGQPGELAGCPASASLFPRAGNVLRRPPADHRAAGAARPRTGATAGRRRRSPASVAYPPSHRVDPVSPGRPRLTAPKGSATAPKGSTTAPKGWCPM